MAVNQPQHWMITGASGLLGHALCRQLVENQKTVSALKSTHDVGLDGLQEISIDITDAHTVEKIIGDQNPDVIVHAAGITNVDECENNPVLAQAVHVQGTRHIARAAQSRGIPLVYISTDHLSDGAQALVDEQVPTAPINVYAKTKRDGERVVFDICDQAFSVRTNFFGPGRLWRPSFSDWILESLEQSTPLNMFVDAYFTPISTFYLSSAIIDLVEKKASGVFNVAGAERISKYDFAVSLAAAAGHSSEPIYKTSLADFGFKAPRPRDMSLSTQKIVAFLGRAMPTVSESINSL